MNEQDIPIDIHVNKLQDWLVSRRIVDKNWHRHVKDVRNNINEALKDMPANESLVKLLSGDREFISTSFIIQSMMRQTTKLDWTLLL